MTKSGNYRIITVCLIAVVMIAGCTSAGNGSSGAVTTDNGRTATFDKLTTKPLPEPPQDLDNESALNYIVNLEGHYGWNKKMDKSTYSIHINVVRSWIQNETESGYIIHLEVGFSTESQIDGAAGSGGGLYTANYFINETTIKRAQVGGQVRPGPDPRNGVVVKVDIKI